MNEKLFSSLAVVFFLPWAVSWIVKFVKQYDYPFPVFVECIK